MKSTLFAAVLATAFLLGGCDNKPKDSTDVAENANEAMVDSNATALQGDDKGDKEDDADYMVHMANSGMYEVQAAKLAESKGASAEIKTFAAMMIKDHTKANEELMALAAKKNVQLPVAIDHDMQDKIDNLNKENGAHFDEKYMSNMKDDHEDDRDYFQKVIDNAQDPELKAFAQKTLPVIEMHLQHAKPMEEHADKREDKADDHKM